MVQQTNDSVWACSNEPSTGFVILEATLADVCLIKKKTKSVKINFKLYKCARVIYEFAQVLSSVWPAVKRTMVEVEAVGTIGHTRVGAFAEMEASPACGALVATATNAGLTQ